VKRGSEGQREAKDRVREQARDSRGVKVKDIERGGEREGGEERGRGDSESERVCV